MRKVLLLFILGAPIGALAQDSIQDLQLSHIQGNVPEREVFNSLLTRDLSAYFGISATGTDNLKWVLLRDGPTQSGVSYPKFYVWAIVDRSKTLTQGAVRVEAIDKTRF